MTSLYKYKFSGASGVFNYVKNVKLYAAGRLTFIEILKIKTETSLDRQASSLPLQIQELEHNRSSAISFLYNTCMTLQKLLYNLIKTS